MHYGYGRKKLQLNDDTYVNKVTLPDGTTTTLYELYFAGTLIRHTKSDQLYVVESLGKIEVDDGSWRTAVFYHPHDITRVNERYARDFRKVAEKFTPVKRVFEIWAGEFQGTSTYIPATKLGEAEAYCFADACRDYFRRDNQSQTLDLTGTRPYLTGYCFLFDNETEAKR